MKHRKEEEILKQRGSYCLVFWLLQLFESCLLVKIGIVGKQ